MAQLFGITLCVGPCMCTSVHTRMCDVDAAGQPWMYHLPPCLEIRILTGWELTKSGLGGQGAQASAFLCLLCTNSCDHFFPPPISPGRPGHRTRWCLSIELMARENVSYRNLCKFGPQLPVPTCVERLCPSVWFLDTLPERFRDSNRK